MPTHYFTSLWVKELTSPLVTTRWILTQWISSSSFPPAHLSVSPGVTTLPRQWRGAVWHFIMPFSWDIPSYLLPCSWPLCTPFPLIISHGVFVLRGRTHWSALFCPAALICYAIAWDTSHRSLSTELSITLPSTWLHHPCVVWTYDMVVRNVFLASADWGAF